RGAHRARARGRSQDAISAAAAVSVDDDDRRPARGAAQPLERRRRVLFSLRLDVHRAPDAEAGAAAAVRDDGNRNLAEPAAGVPAYRREDRRDQRADLVAFVSALSRDSAVL